MRLTQQGERFDLVSSQGSVNVRQVLVDAEGRPIVTPVD